ncbi:carboxynorspermidine decarboxylase [Bacteroides heparinolyticus]|uniref:Carboxynorspermidine/carboxyspermidine decarboxylase n=1 Tax=Prevotella heparinolytica TaxID=28113 RepID=A0A2R3MPC6_9BACE|nr:carboxynorspermidine decarboxylase [Bacteroides heparinolyticus]AVM56746.1 carboxynorspermidine decarboxylase [Bacteroides heparinolyticus]MCI6213009.1 carboxynorspermidine decarboxylase [Bacteroides heparinolyticus]TCO87306.1 carboxynorspermidine decarboxylase [Bacteroides heparinolyticus]
MINFDRFPSPCYIMEEELLRKNLTLIKSVAERAEVEIILAFKAFAMWRSFPIFREYIYNSTASSVYEARLAFEEFGSKAHTYSPAYTEADFPEIMRCSNHITFNSLEQFQRFYPKVRAGQSGISCGIRINPEYSEVETELYNPCAPGTRFGVVADLLPEILPEGMDGFHCHCHCESSSYELERSLAQLESKFSRWFSQIKWLNLGGGHLMTRKDYDVEHLIRLLQGLKMRYPHLHVILEPGSAFTWQTGVLTSEIVDIVENRGIRTAILNVSFTCHMPDCLEMPYQPAVRGSRKGDGGPYVYRLGGNSCLSGDYMGMWSFDHELRIGERIIFEDMIHYTMVKTNMFNGIHHPAIAMWTKEEKAEIFKHFTYEDFRNRMC